MTNTGHAAVPLEPIWPHGGKLVNRVLVGEARTEALARARELSKIALTARATSDFKLLAIGAQSD